MSNALSSIGLDAVHRATILDHAIAQRVMPDVKTNAVNKK